MHLECRFIVSIGGKIIQTVHSVLTKYDAEHIGASCDIVVPLNCRMEYANAKQGTLTAYTLTAFKVGDPVVINVWYVGYPVLTIFKGQVLEFKEGTPCTIRCINYLALQGKLQNFQGTVTIKNLITKITKGTGVNLMLPTIDLTLNKVTFRSMSPWAILEYLKKNIGLNISLLDQNNLYCNVASNTLDVLTYRTDRNILPDLKLQQPDTVWQGYKVKAYFVKENGLKNSVEVGDPEGHLTEVYFYKVAGGTTKYIQLANEALVHCRQRKFSGEVNALLYPAPKLFDKVQFTNVRFPDQNGNYVITGIQHSLSDEGFHIKMKWAFLVDFLNQVA